jgi:hypothetical protein
MSYVQPSDGYAIPAGDFASLLTPLPAGLASTAAPMFLATGEGTSRRSSRWPHGHARKKAPTGAGLLRDSR